MILLFSDIHSSKKAAKDLERLAKDFDTLCCCGDICGYNDDFEYVIDMFIDLDVKAVKGNHDYMLLDPMFPLHRMPKRVADPIFKTRELIQEKHLNYLIDLPNQLEADNLFVIHTWDFDFYVRESEHCNPLLEMTISL